MSTRLRAWSSLAIPPPRWLVKGDRCWGLVFFLLHFPEQPPGVTPQGGLRSLSCITLRAIYTNTGVVIG